MMSSVLASLPIAWSLSKTACWSPGELLKNYRDRTIRGYAHFSTRIYKKTFMENKTGNKIKLGVFVFVTTALFVVGIYLIGQRQKMFVKTFQISGVFVDISGLQVGNNI